MELMLASPFRSSENDDRYERIRTHIETLLKPEQRSHLARAILEQLFFVVVPNAFKQVGRTYYQNVAATYRAAKRLTHPECFPKYFLYRTPGGEISDQVIEGIIQKWNVTADNECEKAIAAALTRFRETDQLGNFFLKLSVFRYSVEPPVVPHFTRVLCKSAESFSRSGEVWSSDYDRAQGILVRLIEDRAPAELVRSLVEEVVITAEPIHFAVSIVLTCHRPVEAGLVRIGELVDLHFLRQLATKRLSDFYVAGGRDIFADLAEPDWQLILYQWGTDWMTGSGESRREVQNYVIHLLRPPLVSEHAKLPRTRCGARGRNRGFSRESSGEHGDGPRRGA